MDKFHILTRVRTILSDMRTTISRSKLLGEEVEELEVLVDEAEKEYARLVDNYMAERIEARNRERGYAKKRNRHK